MALTKEQILAAQDTQVVTEHVPEWGGDVLLKPMSGKARNAFEKSLVSVSREESIDNIYARILVHCMVDENGERLFSDADADALGEKSGAVLGRLTPVAQRLSGLTKDDIEEAKKNSSGTPT